MRYFVLVLSFFVVLLGAAFELAMAQEVETAVSATSTPSPPVQATPAPDEPEVTPTKDRLAPPPTVEHPTQLDDGAYLYWLYCIPCHGDVGQGLTDEWRAEYPEEDQYCWNSTCHGSNPPQPYGFHIPTVVPPIVLSYGGLERFDTMGEIYYYTRGAMPLELPGRLTDEEYLAIMVFLANEIGIWNGETYTAENVLKIRLRPDEVIELEPTATPQPTATNNAVTTISSPLLGAMALGFGLVIVVGGVFIWRRQNQTTDNSE